MQGKLTAVMALQKAVARRNWEEVEKEVEDLTAIIVEECTRPIIKTVTRPVFSAGISRYIGNSGYSGGCTQPLFAALRHRLMSEIIREAA